MSRTYMTMAPEPPTAGMLGVCDALDATIIQYLGEVSKLRVGTYEADVEALLMFKLGVRQVQGVLVLARQSIALVPAAFHLARAAFECCARAAWLVNEDKPLLREARFIAHLNGEISALKRSSDRLAIHGVDVQLPRARAATLEEFSKGLSEKLHERGFTSVAQLPNFEQLVTSIGGNHLYATYIEASQYSHGGHAATWLYRRSGLGTGKQIEDSVSCWHWVTPLRMCWLALGHPGDILISRIASTDDARWSQKAAAAVDEAFDKFAAEIIAEHAFQREEANEPE